MARVNCRGCESELGHVFLDLGNCPPSNSFLEPDEVEKPETFYPLKVMVCDQCFLVQVDESKNHREIFNESYPYFSSQSRTWLKHSEDYAKMMMKKYGVNSETKVVEVASNDGYLLQFFKAAGIPVLGVDPTANTAKRAQEKGIETLVDFFGTGLAKKLVAGRGCADLVIGNNVLAHVPDLHDFVRGISVLLSGDGIVTLEFPHLLNLVAQNQFDTIYHEHFSYFSLGALVPVFKMHGLEFFDVEELPTHGGSLRVFTKNSFDDSKPVNPNVSNLLKKEEEAGMRRINYYKDFEPRAQRVKYDLLQFLIEKKREGRAVAGYGAAAKGNTLLNYSRVTSDLIPYIGDITPAKQGKYTPGSHIPVVSEEELLKRKPDYVVIFPWNFKEEAIGRLSSLRENGTRFVIPIPEVRVVD